MCNNFEQGGEPWNEATYSIMREYGVERYHNGLACTRKCLSVL